MAEGVFTAVFSIMLVLVFLGRSLVLIQVVGWSQGEVVFVDFYLVGCGLFCCLDERSIAMRSYEEECFVRFSILGGRDRLESRIVV